MTHIEPDISAMKKRSKGSFLHHIVQRCRFGEWALAATFILWLVMLATPSSADPIKIVVFGDSLTSGYQLQEDQSFPRVLENKLNSAGFDVVVMNMSLAGDTTTGALERVKQVALARPDVTIIALGSNDTLRGIDPSKIIYPNLYQITGMVQSTGSAVLLVGVKAPPNMGKDYDGRLQAGLQQIVNYLHVMYYPFLLDGIAGQAQFNLADGIHPNADGVKVIVNKIYPYVDKLVRWKMEEIRQKIEAQQ